MNASVGRLAVPVAVILMALVCPAQAQINLGGGGPIGPGGQQTDLHPEDPAQKAERTRKQAAKAMQQGTEQRAKGRVQAAITSFKSAMNLALQPGADGHSAVDSGIVTSAVEQLKQIYDEGKKKLEAARKAYEDKK